MTPRHQGADASSNSGRIARYAVWLGAVLILAVAIYPLVRRGRGTKATPDPIRPGPVVVEVAPAQMQAVDTVVSTQGTLAPAEGRSARIAPTEAGRLVAVHVREGDRVAIGEIIAVVDTRVKSAVAGGAAAALRASQLEAKQSSLAAEGAKVAKDDAVQSATLQLQIAQTELEKLRKGPRQQELAQADQAVNQAKATRDRASTELERVRFLYEKGIAAKRDLDDAEAASLVADAALETARQQADLLRAGARPEELKAAELQVQSAQAALRQAEHHAIEVAQKETEARAASESVRGKRAELSAAQATADAALLRSPIPGVVAHRMLNPGDMADPSTPVAEVTDPRMLDLLGKVPAQDAAKVHVSMMARVAVDEAPGRVFPGRVLSVGEVDPETGLADVRITINNPDLVLRVGAFAGANIVVGTNPRAVVVPKEALVTRDGTPYVFVVGHNSVARQRSVSVGVEQGSVVEILRGVAVDDEVIRLGQYELADGTKVQAAKRKGRAHAGRL